MQLRKIPPEGLDLSYEIPDPSAVGISLAVPAEGPLEASFHLERLGGKLRVSGMVRATVRLQCSRCLREFAFPAGGEVDTTFVPRAWQGAEDRELAEEDLEVESLQQGGVDLRELIAEQIHLALPIRALCDEGCRGWCARCGRNLNEGACACGPDGPDPRWDALQKLKVH